MGSTKEVHGFVDGVRIRENEVFIDLVGIKGEKISLHIGNPFKINHEQEFRYLYFFEKYLLKSLSEKHKVICNSIGLVTDSSKGRVIEIFDYRDIAFDKLSLYQVRNIIA